MTVAWREGLLEHDCERCGEPAAFGYAVRQRTGNLGRWFCHDHRPDPAPVLPPEPVRPLPPRQHKLV